MELEGATVLVAGTSRGIGRALAERFAKEPVRLLAGVSDLDEHDPLDIGAAREVRPVQLDLSSRASIERDLASLDDEIGRIDLLVAGAPPDCTTTPFGEQTLDHIYGRVHMSVTAPVHLARAVLPGMLARRGGKVVSVSNGPVLSGFAERLRRELVGTSVTTLHVITGGALVGPHAWAGRILGAVVDDREMLTGDTFLGSPLEQLPDASA